MNVATPDRRRFSRIFEQFPWSSLALVAEPKSIMAHSEMLPGFQVSVNQSITVVDICSFSLNRIFLNPYPHLRIPSLDLREMKARAIFWHYWTLPYQGQNRTVL